MDLPDVMFFSNLDVAQSLSRQARSSSHRACWIVERRSSFLESFRTGTGGALHFGSLCAGWDPSESKCCLGRSAEEEVGSLDGWGRDGPSGEKVEPHENCPSPGDQLPPGPTRNSCQNKSTSPQFHIWRQPFLFCLHFSPPRCALATPLQFRFPPTSPFFSIHRDTFKMRGEVRAYIVAA